ncbi:MFS transporter [Haladaptatus sp. R4]|uniref:OFA family MFS transporter n=1 Tax=Haladaptatus sp. R4 TaxID=1679489 RepID=UPI0007B4BEE8|nr:OFA family MFS transporter [Haladaptatus sp. R4]KZN24083.1 MFS transporter [Haladaptatus sp. R4]
MSTTDVDYSARAKDVLGFSRWWQVAAAVVMMGLVSPYQYVWSSLRSPIANRLAIDPAALGAVFTLFVIFQAGSQFPVGWWRDRHGPRALTLLAGILAGGGYLALSRATSVWQLYLFYSLGAIGVGIVYTVAVNTALKWFPDRRGLTTGLGTMAFAAGSALVVPYVRTNATASSYPGVLWNMGLLIGIGIIVGAVVLRDPPKGWLEATADGGDEATEMVSGPQYTWREMAGTWQFWVMYVMFVCASGAGLMLTAKVVSFAEHFGLAAMIATVSAIVLPLSGGAGRLIVGDASDRIDRERAMAVSFFLCGVGLFAVVWFANVNSDIGFVLAVIVATFFWSPQYTLFPSVVGDYYGREHSSANYALLYSGKMWGGVFGGAVTGFLVTAMGWTVAFLIGGVLAIVAALGALLLRPPTHD